MNTLDKNDRGLALNALIGLTRPNAEPIEFVDLRKKFELIPEGIQEYFVNLLDRESGVFFLSEKKRTEVEWLLSKITK